MTRPKKAAAETDVVLEQPTTGGSFLRQPDGSLLRVEHPPEGDQPAAPIADEPGAGDPPAGDAAPDSNQTEQ